MAELGFRSINEMVGRVDALDIDHAVDHWKAKGIDLSKLLAPAVGFHDGVQVYCTVDQDHALDEVLDWKLLEQAKNSIQTRQRVEIDSEIKNTDRSVGAILSHHVVKTHGPDGLPENTIGINFVGSAGQSLGAFLSGGISLQVEGDANDYVGKGMSGGRIVVRPPRTARFAAEKNIIIGNVALYGATAGEAYFRGVAAERFAVRNSGAVAVVEGVGDHGCEYMTGGRVVVLGPTGRNFAAGMSGGIAYIYDPNDQLLNHLNLELVELGPVESQDDRNELHSLIENHARFTDSTVAAGILENWDSELNAFKKIIPGLYRKILEQKSAESLER